MSNVKLVMALLSLLNLTISTKAVPNYLTRYCSNTSTYTTNSTYQTNLDTLLSSLSSNSTRNDLNGFYNASSGNFPGEVIQGLYQCRGDLSFEVCQDCVTFATTDIVQLCPDNKVAVIWYNECLLRYSNQSIFSRLSTNVRWLMSSSQNVSLSEQSKFKNFVRTALTETASEATDGSSEFAAKEVSGNGNFSDMDRLYTLVQCTQDLSASDCESCLQQAIALLPSCCYGKIGGRVLFPSCYFRYEVYSFYNLSAVVAPPPPPPPVAVPSPPPPVQ